jgi:hypothetical protein
MTTPNGSNMVDFHCGFAAGERSLSVWHQGGGSSGASHFSKGELHELCNVVPVHNGFSLTTNVVRNQLLDG